MKKFNTLHGDEPTDTPIEWNSQPPSVHFKYRNSTPKTISVVSAIMWRLNHHDVDNGDVQVYLSDYPFKYTSYSVTDMNTTPIKSIGYDEMEKLL